MVLDKVLLLINDEISRQHLEKQLQACYDLTSAPTLAAAQAALGKGHFDLIIADVELPDGTAIDLLDQLQSSPIKPLVVIISSFGCVESAAECLNHGACAYFLK